MLRRIEGRRRRWRQRRRCLDFITNSMDMSLCKLWEVAKARKVWSAAVHGVTKSQTRLSNWMPITTARSRAGGLQVRRGWMGSWGPMGPTWQDWLQEDTAGGLKDLYPFKPSLSFPVHTVWWRYNGAHLAGFWGQREIVHVKVFCELWNELIFYLGWEGWYAFHPQNRKPHESYGDILSSLLWNRMQKVFSLILGCHGNHSCWTEYYHPEVSN